MIDRLFLARMFPGPEGVRLEGHCVFLSTRKVLSWSASTVDTTGHAAKTRSAHDTNKGIASRSGDSGNTRSKSKGKTRVLSGKKKTKQPQESSAVTSNNARTDNQSQRSAAPDSDAEIVDLSLSQSQRSHPTPLRLFHKHVFLFVGLNAKDADAIARLIDLHGGHVAKGLLDFHESECRKVVLAAPTAYREIGYLYAVACGTPPLHSQWVRDCCSELMVLPLPKYELSLGFISRMAKEKVCGSSVGWSDDMEYVLRQFNFFFFCSSLHLISR